MGQVESQAAQVDYLLVGIWLLSLLGISVSGLCLSSGVYAVLHGATRGWNVDGPMITLAVATVAAFVFGSGWQRHAAWFGGVSLLLAQCYLILAPH